MANQSPIIVTVNPGCQPHFSDHLAPLSAVMDIPYVVTNEAFALYVEELYPGLKTIVIPWADFTMDFLFENFDMIIGSEPWERKRFYTTFEPLEEQYNKQFRNVFCPHGFSDKIFWFKEGSKEDILLYYGQNMLDIYEETDLKDCCNTLVRVGNYRYQYYRLNKEKQDQLTQERVFNQFKRQQKTILYAPTWNDAEKNTSMFDSEPILQNLPDNYNLIVKLHPAVKSIEEVSLEKFFNNYTDKGNIIFLKNWQMIYPMLNKVDIYIGDMSSIGYDFLAFNRPMFFLNQWSRDHLTDRNAYLFSCGHIVDPKDYAHIYRIIEEEAPRDHERYTHARKEMFYYTFGEDVPFATIKEEITKAYFSPKKWEYS